jgi:hypothetical protein
MAPGTPFVDSSPSNGYVSPELMVKRWSNPQVGREQGRARRQLFEGEPRRSQTTSDPPSPPPARTPPTATSTFMTTTQTAWWGGRDRRRCEGAWPSAGLGRSPRSRGACGADTRARPRPRPAPPGDGPLPASPLRVGVRLAGAFGLGLQRGQRQGACLQRASRAARRPSSSPAPAAAPSPAPSCSDRPPCPPSPPPKKELPHVGHLLRRHRARGLDRRL